VRSCKEHKELDGQDQKAIEHGFESADIVAGAVALKVYDIVVKVGIGILSLILCLKAFFIYDGTTDESYGFYFVN